MHLDFLWEVFLKNPNEEAIIWRGTSYSYHWLRQKIGFWQDQLLQFDVQPGMIVALEGDFSPESIALFLALTDHGTILVPLMNTISSERRNKCLKIAQVEWRFHVDLEDKVSQEAVSHAATHPFFQRLREQKQPGLVVFSSGSSGEPKAAVHNFARLLEKFKTPRPSLRMLNFLLWDHWGGLNTMLHTLSNAGAVIIAEDRSPEAVCQAIQRYRIEVLPASPTFLNLLLLSKAYSHYDLSCLKIISYGTEPMPESTLKHLQMIFSHVKLQQTYGLIELGVLRSKSKSSDSLWVKIGGEGFEWRVRDGLLEIKAQSAMMGYLNAPSPFTEEGWFMTGDAVEVEGEYLRILGRQSELINVGGEKVYPAEVESVIQELENVAEVTVYKEKNPITGNVVCAKVRLSTPEDPKAFAKRLKAYCRERLPSYKVPVKVVLDENSQVSDRMKKVRYVPVDPSEKGSA